MPARRPALEDADREAGSGKAIRATLTRARSGLAALALLPVLSLVLAPLPARARPDALDLADRIRSPIAVAPEVTWYRIEQDGAPAGHARFELVPPAAGADPLAPIELRAEIVQGAHRQRALWAFTPRLELVRFEETLETESERRALSGVVEGGVVRSTFSIPGATPRTFETPVPPGAIARYAANLVLLAPENLFEGAQYRWRQLSPRTGRFARVSTRVRAAPTPGRFLLETTTDELPELVVETEVAPRSREHPNGVALRSEQRAGGVRVAITRVANEAAARRRSP